MKTSYFARMNSKNFKGREMNAVSIARSCRYWNGRVYKPLMPTWDIINISDPVEYERVYREKILSKLDPLEVWEDLGEDAILLCHESAAKIESGEQFCHRTMVAKWLEEELWLQYDMDVTITELKDDKEDLKKILKNGKMKGQVSLW